MILFSSFLSFVEELIVVILTDAKKIYTKTKGKPYFPSKGLKPSLKLLHP